MSLRVVTIEELSESDPESDGLIRNQPVVGNQNPRLPDQNENQREQVPVHDGI